MSESFIGPKLYPDKYLPCSVCGEPVRIPDKFRRAKTATHGECLNKEPDRSEV